MADVTIKVRAEGPYKVTGPVLVRDASGHIVAGGATDDDPGTGWVLCRCGRSSAAPMCDSSHRRTS